MCSSPSISPVVSATSANKASLATATNPTRKRLPCRSEVGPAVGNLKAGDHVLVPFNIACGQCHFCKQGLFGNCHESNPQATAVGAIFGYSHTAGGQHGGQARERGGAHGAG